MNNHDMNTRNGRLAHLSEMDAEIAAIDREIAEKKRQNPDIDYSGIEAWQNIMKSTQQSLRDEEAELARRERKRKMLLAIIAALGVAWLAVLFRLAQ